MANGKIMGMFGALALAATPIAANAADASKLSLSSAATTAAVQDGGEGGSGAGIFAAVLGVGIAAILVLGLTIGEGDDDEAPTSP